MESGGLILDQLSYIWLHMDQGLCSTDMEMDLLAICLLFTGLLGLDGL